jgi:hypothetical protein
MTTKQTKAFLIRNFGDDRQYDDLDSVLDALRTHYRGKSIALHIVGGRNRLVRPFFLDIGQDGELYESYAPQPFTRVDPRIFRDASLVPSGAAS